MTDDVRPATAADRAVLADIAAEAFFSDPVLSWVFPDPAARLGQLRDLFGGLVDDTLPDRGALHLLGDGCAAFWRDPEHSRGRTASDRLEDAADGGPPPYPADVMARLEALGDTTRPAHPEEPHWYLNVLATRPARQARGLGGRTIAPVLARCDADGLLAHLESTNPRNVAFYERHGFVRTAELRVPDGPVLTAMQRAPRARPSEPG